MNKKSVWGLGLVLLLTACSGVELVETGTEYNSKVPAEVGEYKFFTPAMASSADCFGVPAFEGYQGVSTKFFMSVVLYVKDGFAPPDTGNYDDCSDFAVWGRASSGVLRVMTSHHGGSELHKCEDSENSVPPSRWCAVSGPNRDYSVSTVPIGSKESQLEELTKFVEEFDKHVQYNIPEDLDISQ